MLNPIVKYKSYHTDNTNIYIHQLCVPLILMTIYSVSSIYFALSVNIFYSITYLLFDIFSKKSIHSFYYLQCIFILHFILKNYVPVSLNILIHVFSWALQIIGHKFFEKNTPAFLDNLYDSFLFAPYFTFLETFYPSSFETKEKYNIIKNNYDASKNTILYFAGLFQKANLEYDGISNDLPNYNHIYINVNFGNNDIYKDTLLKIMDELNDINIECIVGFSFGGSLSLQFKELYFEKYKKEIKSILISTGGFQSHTFLEKIIKNLGNFLYSLYYNDKWYMIKNYPIYQNTCKLDKNDYVIVSLSDTIHNPTSVKLHDNILTFKNASHLSMIKIIKRQHIISQLIQNDYQLEKVNTKPLTSNFDKFIFGGHFYPYHITLWLSISIYNLYYYIKNEYSFDNFIYGFIVGCSTWCFTEYTFHRFMLHHFFYKHHKKHHVFPNKLSIINTPMSMVILNWYLYYFILKIFLNQQIFVSFCIFLPLNYLSFEFTHLLSHNYKGSNKIILNAKYYHKLHHIDENINYSFITPFWDYLFGTLSPKYNTSFIELLFGFIPFYSFLIHKKTEF